MNIAIIGTGYVGLVSGACFSEVGADVTCIDIDKSKIENLRKGIIPIYEPGLDELVNRNVAAGRLHFVTDLEAVIDHVEIVFCAVGTPPNPDGSADLSHVLEVSREFARTITRYTLFVVKSTVPPGTHTLVKECIDNVLAEQGKYVSYGLASNPEFLKEGAAIKDFMSPDRVVIGIENDRDRALMEQLYRPFLLNNFRVMFMSLASAEMTKYAANAMLATRISFINEIANLCECVGADVNSVRTAIGADARIGNKFLYPGCGYGGSCFPKDVQALIHTGEQYGQPMRIIRAVEEVNHEQKEVVYNKLKKLFDGNLKGKNIAIWGLAFKPETDDMRSAPSLEVISRLLADGANVSVYDPIANDECRRHLGNAVRYANDMYDALIDADAMALLTEWKQFRLPSWYIVAQTMRGNNIVDGRNIYRASDLKPYGLILTSIGIKSEQ